MNPINRVDEKVLMAALHHEHGVGIEDDFDTILKLVVQLFDFSSAAIAYAYPSGISFKFASGLSRKENTLVIPYGLNNSNSIPDSLEEYWVSYCSNEKNKRDFYFLLSIHIPETKNPPAYLCAFDREARTFSDQQFSSFKLLAKQASAVLQLKSQNISLKQCIANSSSIDNEEINTLFHNAIDAVIVLDTKGVILEWNPKAKMLFGWNSDEVIGKLFHETILPGRYQEMHLNLMHEFEYYADDLEFKRTVEIGAIRKDQSEFYIALGISRFNRKSNRFYICFISDITERKMVATQLKEQRKFYETILNKLPTDIAVFDPDHKYLFVNPGAISVEEYREFIIGKDDYEYAAYRGRDIAIADLRRARFLEVKTTGKEIRWEDTLLNLNGKSITHLRSMFPVHDELGKLSMVIGFGLDITDRKIMEEKQDAMVLQLSAQNGQLIDFCNIVSHNLRGPLVNMSLLVQYIEDSIEPADQHLLISKLKPVIENLSSTFNELVESIQIKQDLDIVSVDIDLVDCLDRTLEGLRPEVSKIKAKFEVDFEEISKINFPPKYLYSIFHNLISNALKYHSPKRTPVIKLKTKKQDGNVLLSVNDNGLGIDLYKHRENFFKIGKVFHRHPNAKGFGLYMTKTQVEAMKGKIWVESTPDVGSTFFIEFSNQ